MNLSKLFFLLCLKVITFFMVGVSAPLMAAPADKTLRLAVIYIEEPPFVYTSASSEYLGIVPRLAEALSRELNLKLEYLPIPRKGLEQSLLDGKADMAWLSPDWVLNKEQLIFSDAIFLHREFLFAKEPFEKNSEPLDWLKDKTVCIRQDYQYPTLNRFFENKVARAVPVSSQVPLVMLLLKGRCDLLYMNEHRATWMTNRLGVEHKVWRSNRALSESKLAFMFTKTWQNRMLQINQALAAIKGSGELDSIIQTNIQPKAVAKVAIH
jgi:polar amino acid transport system substrate-binding protein